MTGSLKLGFIGGGGWLAQTIIKALLHKGVFQASEMAVSYRSKAPDSSCAALVTTDSQELVDACDTIVLSVRPADFKNLKINASGKLVISVMAGVPAEVIARATGATRIIRALPNVAASVGLSYTPLVATNAATPADRALVTRIFEACGLCDEVDNEEQLDYLTGLSGSGPAFPALIAEALAADAVKRGLSPRVAERTVMQLLIGTGRLLEVEPKPVAEIVREFVDYGGVIAAAITTMRQKGFDEAIEAGMTAALKKVESLKS